MLQYSRDRQRQAAWDKRNLRTVSTHLTVQDAETLKAWCRENDITPYHLLKNILLSIVREAERAQDVGKEEALGTR